MAHAERHNGSFGRYFQFHYEFADALRDDSTFASLWAQTPRVNATTNSEDICCTTVLNNQDLLKRFSVKHSPHGFWTQTNKDFELMMQSDQIPLIKGGLSPNLPNNLLRKSKASRATDEGISRNSARIGRKNKPILSWLNDHIAKHRNAWNLRLNSTIREETYQGQLFLQVRGKVLKFEKQGDAWLSEVRAVTS